MKCGGIRNSETKDKFFSIIVVTYNCENVLECTIKSILNQNCSDYEIIVIDGNSTDKTLEVIKKYNEKIAYWQSEPDKGIYDAMNKGVLLTQGKWLFFLNSGDVFANNEVLLKIKELLSKCNVDLLYGKACTKAGDVLYHPKKISKLMFLLERMVCHQAIFAKKKCFEKNLFNADYKIISDRIWLYNCYKKIKILNSDIIVCIYDTEGLSSNQNKFDKESLAFTKSISLLGYIIGKIKRVLKR